VTADGTGTTNSRQLHLATMDRAYARGRRAAWLGVTLNLALGLLKLVAGLLGNCFALVSDAVHSFSDVVTSLAVLLGMRISAKPADSEHPYGHSRAEAIIGLYVAMALAAAGVMVAREALSRIAVEQVMPAWYTLLAAGISVVVKEGLYQYKSRLGRQIHSRAITADAWHHRSDALSSVAVFVGIVISRWTGAWWADGAAALVVAVSIIWAGLSLLKSTMDELMDRQAPDEMLRAVRSIARGVPGVVDVEKLFVRKAGLEYLVDVHIEVEPHLTVMQSHEIAHAVQSTLQSRLPHIHSVLVHIEPAGRRIASGMGGSDQTV